MVLGQVKVGERSNEIVAILALLELLAIEGAVVTVDAMGCQREIAQTIIDKKADYILALKGNQGTLRDDVELFAREQKAVAFSSRDVGGGPWPGPPLRRPAGKGANETPDLEEQLQPHQIVRPEST